jgi:gas vesicle protein
MECNSTSPQLKEDIHKLENRCDEAIEELKNELKNLNK